MTNAGSKTEDRQTLRSWLAEAPYGLAMSSGFFAFFAHTGMMTVLEDEGLVPARVSGSSAGALVTGTWASGVDAPVLAGELEKLERAHFWDPAPGFGLLRGRRFRDKLETMLVKGSFERCRVPAAVSVFDVKTRSTHVLSHGALAPALTASCAVPGLFHPVHIGGRAYLDGGIKDRPGLEGMPPAHERVLFHHIASKSPWRMALATPRRTGMITLVLDGLPRSGPFRLAEGRRAYVAARAAVKAALDRPIEDGAVVISVP